MYITYSKVVGLNIYDLKSRTCLGKVEDIVIDNDNLKVIALILRKQSFWDKKIFAVVESDILEISKLGVVVNDENAIADLDELIRIKSKVSDGYLGVEQRVQSENGKNLGTVFDLLFDSKSFEITKLYTKNIFDEKIFSCKSILSYENNIITVKEEQEKIKVTAEETEASIA